MFRVTAYWIHNRLFVLTARSTIMNSPRKASTLLLFCNSDLFRCCLLFCFPAIETVAAGYFPVALSLLQLCIVFDSHTNDHCTLNNVTQYVSTVFYFSHVWILKAANSFTFIFQGNAFVKEINYALKIYCLPTFVKHSTYGTTKRFLITLCVYKMHSMFFLWGHCHKLNSVSKIVRDRSYLPVQ